jgi:hypothetical protein
MVANVVVVVDVDVVVLCLFYAADPAKGFMFMHVSE